MKKKSSVSCAVSRDILKRLATLPQMEWGGGELQMLVLFIPWDGSVFVLPDAWFWNDFQGNEKTVIE